MDAFWGVEVSSFLSLKALVLQEVAAPSSGGRAG